MSKHSKDLKLIAAAIQGTQPVAARDTSRHVSDKLPIHAHLAIAFFGGTKKALRARAIKRSYPIRAQVGPNGGGKSLDAVDQLIPDLERGRTCLSTVRLIDRKTGDDHPAYEPFYDFDQLLDAHHTSVFMDEVVGIANSRDSSKLSARVQNVLVQLRRRDCSLIWTAPNWARADKIIREVTQAVTECRGYFSDTSMVADEDMKLWAPKRVFRFRTFDTIDFEEWTSGKRDKVDPVRGASVWFKGVGSEAFETYDTLDAVTQVAHASETGICQVCEGRITVKPCRCAVPVRASKRAAAAEVSDDELLELVDRAHHAEHPMLAELSNGAVVV